MKAKVISPYTDRDTGDVHMGGEIVELTEERFAAISARGFVEAAEELGESGEADQTEVSAEDAGAPEETEKPAARKPAARKPANRK